MDPQSSAPPPPPTPVESASPPPPASSDPVPAPQPPPVPEAAGLALRRLHSGVHPSLRDFSALVSDYLEGVWLPEDSGAVGRRAVALGRKLLARETESHMLQGCVAAAEARAASLQAQLEELIGAGGGSVRLREELQEARQAHTALQAQLGQQMGALFEAHSASLAEENADLRLRLAASQREATELREVLVEARRAGGQERTELDVFGEWGPGEGSTVRWVNKEGR